MTNDEQNYEMCFRIENIQLPRNGYFGVTAATGGLADDHDVLHFLTYSLYPAEQQPPPQAEGELLQWKKQRVVVWKTRVGVTGEDQKKLTQEYHDYQQKLEQQKEEYRKEHPDQVSTKNWWFFWKYVGFFLA